ncbi:MAG: class I SAM-dependent methyltransferase [Phycisphaerales bacterium]
MWGAGRELFTRRLLAAAGGREVVGFDASRGAIAAADAMKEVPEGAAAASFCVKVIAGDAWPGREDGTGDLMWFRSWM